MTDENDARKVTLGEHHTADINQQEEHAQDALDRSVISDEAAKVRSVKSDKQRATATEQSRIGFKEVKYILYVTIVCLLLMISVSALAWSTVRSNTEQLVKLAESGEAQRLRLIDCTTPEGECFRESQARTAEVVGSLNAATMAAAWCAKTLPATATLAELQACTAEAMVTE